MPHRVLAAVDYLVLERVVHDYRGAQDEWPAFRAALVEHADFVARFVREQPIQTNEPQRCWALLPLFLTVARAAGRPLDLLELGAAAGFNLLWDRYRYEYDAGRWGAASAPLVLRGEERTPFPAELLQTDVVVRRRLGVDLSPVDATTDEGLMLLSCFTVDEARRERVRLAADVLRREPPELIRADYVEVLPELLRARDEGALTVVFQTISTIYLPLASRERVRAIVDDAAREGPLAWISTPTPEEHGLRGHQHPLELAIWPVGERRLVGEMSNGGDWLDWWR